MSSDPKSSDPKSSDPKSSDPTALPADLPCRRTTGPPTTCTEQRCRPSRCRPPTARRSTCPRCSAARSSTPTRAPASPAARSGRGLGQRPRRPRLYARVCGSRDHHAELSALGARVFGLSTQDTDYQQRAVDNLSLPFPLLSDARPGTGAGGVATDVRRPGQTLLKRLTLVVDDGVVDAPVVPGVPARHPRRSGPRVAARPASGGLSGFFAGVPVVLVPRVAAVHRVLQASASVSRCPAWAQAAARPAWSYPHDTPTAVPSGQGRPTLRRHLHLRLR